MWMCRHPALPLCSPETRTDPYIGCSPDQSVTQGLFPTLRSPGDNTTSRMLTATTPRSVASGVDFVARSLKRDPAVENRCAPGLLSIQHYDNIGTSPTSRSLTPYQFCCQQFYQTYTKLIYLCRSRVLNRSVGVKFRLCTDLLYQLGKNWHCEKYKHGYKCKSFHKNNTE